MKYFILIVLLVANSFGYGHDIRMAIFEISKQDNGYILEVSMDRDDFEKSIFSTYPTYKKTKESQVKEQFIADYLQSNFQLHINSRCQEMSVKSIDYDDENIRIVLALTYKGKVKQVEVLNTCLIDYTPGHRNIFKANLNDRVRTFNLNEKRISTSFVY